MVSELKKSISYILYERITSPLYGTFIISWLAWNWKIPYVTLFVNENKLSVNRIDFIINSSLNWKILFLYPALSTVFLITIMPFISTGAFWIALKFDNWRRTIKIEIENKQLLTLEQSIEIREEMRTQMERFAQQMENKDKENITLKSTIEALQERKKPKLHEPDNPVRMLTDKERYEKEYNKLSLNNNFLGYVLQIAENIQNGYSLSGIPTPAVSFFVANNLIDKINGRYDFTEKGKYFLKEYINNSP